MYLHFRENLKNVIYKYRKLKKGHYFIIIVFRLSRLCEKFGFLPLDEMVGNRKKPPKYVANILKLLL